MVSDPVEPRFFRPERTITGPAYSIWFKLLATFVCIGLAGYALHIGFKFPLLQYGFGVKVLLLGAALMLAVSYYWFMRSSVTIDARGITQTWIVDKKIEWPDVRSAKMIGVPYLSGVFPPRLIVRTGTAFVTFNGGNRELLIAFAKISLAFQMKK